MKVLRSLEQNRAKYAFECIQKVQGFNNVDLEDKYKSYVKRAPSLIQTNGLGNTLVFFKSKFGSDLKKELEKQRKEGKSDKEAYEEAFKKLNSEKKAYKMLYDHLDGWFKKHFRRNDGILEWITKENTSSIDVFQVAKEMIALLNWMKRFADAELRDKK